jgi:hypothetical protein
LTAAVQDQLSIDTLISQLKAIPAHSYFTLFKLNTTEDYSQSSYVFIENDEVTILCLKGKLVKINILTSKTIIVDIEPKEERVNFSCNRWHDKLVLFGGKSLIEEKLFNEVLIFDLTEQSYCLCESENPIQPRFGHSANIINNTLYIYSGFMDTGMLRDLWTLDLDKCLWEQIDTKGYILSNLISLHSTDVNGKICLACIVRENLQCKNTWLKVKLEKIYDRQGNFLVLIGEVGEMIRIKAENLMVFQEVCVMCNIGGRVGVLGISDGNFAAAVVACNGGQCKNLEVLRSEYMEAYNVGMKAAAFFYKGEVYVCVFNSVD